MIYFSQSVKLILHDLGNKVSKFPIPVSLLSFNVSKHTKVKQFQIVELSLPVQNMGHLSHASCVQLCVGIGRDIYSHVIQNRVQRGGGEDGGGCEGHHGGGGGPH